MSAVFVGSFETPHIRYCCDLGEFWQIGHFWEYSPSSRVQYSPFRGTVIQSHCIKAVCEPSQSDILKFSYCEPVEALTWPWQNHSMQGNMGQIPLHNM